jgi:hypothetical protein
MAYIATHRDFDACTGSERTAKAAKPSLLRRFYDAVMEARQRQANRELAQFLVRSGGRLTDDIEREMTQRLSRGDWNFRA